jgi:hypothetical protein
MLARKGSTKVVGTVLGPGPPFPNRVVLVSTRRRQFGDAVDLGLAYFTFVMELVDIHLY